MTTRLWVYCNDLPGEHCSSCHADEYNEMNETYIDLPGVEVVVRHCCTCNPTWAQVVDQIINTYSDT